MKTHALTSLNGPGICGAGQGAKLFQRVRGTPIDELATASSIDDVITCKRCRKRVRERFPAWFDVATLTLVPR